MTPADYTEREGGVPVIYHGTPFTTRAALNAVMPGRAACVSFFRPDDLEAVLAVCPQVMFDHGAFSFWMQAMRAGREWDEADRQIWWRAYYDWLEPNLFVPGRWAIMPDSPAAPSQLNDGLLNDWPFGERGAPVWHMDGPVERLARLCDRYPRVCVGWIGDPKKEPVGCEAYFRKMDEIARLMGNTWHPLHMLRGILVAREYPFISVDSTSLAQNGHRYDWHDLQPDLLEYEQGADGIWRWRGRNAYADRLEQGYFSPGVLGTLRANRAAARRERDSSPVRFAVERSPLQLGIL